LPEPEPFDVRLERARKRARGGSYVVPCAQSTSSTALSAFDGQLGDPSMMPITEEEVVVESALGQRIDKVLGTVTSGSSIDSRLRQSVVALSETLYGRYRRVEPTDTATLTADGPGTLSIFVSHAVGLRAADRGGTSDPYVVLRTAGQEARSKVIKKNLDPVWNDTLQLEGEFSDFLNTGLLLAVYDSDIVGQDDSLGDARVSLRELRNSPNEEYTVRLTDPRRRNFATGKVTFRVSWSADELGEEEALARAMYHFDEKQLHKKTAVRSRPLTANTRARAHCPVSLVSIEPSWPHPYHPCTPIPLALPSHARSSVQ
jgi:hypothetical protein